MVLLWAWRGGIADYHPNPEGWGNTLRTPERSDGGGGYCPTPKDEDGNQQYLRAMLTVLSLSLGKNSERSFFKKMSVLSNTTFSTIRIFFARVVLDNTGAFLLTKKCRYYPGWFGIGKYQATRRLAFSFLPNDNVGYHFSSRLTAILNLCPIYLKIFTHQT